MGSNPAFRKATPPIKIDYSQLPRTGREDQNKYDGTGIVKSYATQVEEFTKIAEQVSYAGTIQRCETHGMAKVIFACDHCEHQDPVHPNGMIMTPYRYFLCNRCYAKHQLMSLDFAHELKTRCWNCILDEWSRIKLINPTILHDWQDKPNRGSF
jgi:hypothetical protein